MDILLGWLPIVVIGIVGIALFIRWCLKRNAPVKRKDDAFGNMDKMTGIEFEDMLSLLLRHRGYDVQKTPQTGDMGADLILEKDGERIGVQAKRSSSKVGNASVMQAQSGATFYNCQYAWVMTNNEFTPQAVKQAEGCGVSLYGRNDIINLQNQVRQIIREQEKEEQKKTKSKKTEKKDTEEKYLKQANIPIPKEEVKYGIIRGSDSLVGCVPAKETSDTETYVYGEKEEEKPANDSKPVVSIYDAENENK